MLKFISRILVHPWFLSALNGWFCIIVFTSIYDIIVCNATPIKEKEDIIEGVAVILIAWGVALEERAKLREVFGLMEPAGSGLDDHEAELDESCHRYGLGLLLLGLFAEVGAETIKIPDRIINTCGIEYYVILLSGALLLAGGILMLKQVIHLIFKSKSIGVPLPHKG